MFFSRLAAKMEELYDKPFWPCNIVENNHFYKASINEIVKYIKKRTNGMTKVTPDMVYKRLYNSGGDRDSNTKIINKYITDGLQITNNKVYNPWVRPAVGHTQGQSTLKALSNTCGIPLEALWGIYNKSKDNFTNWIDSVYNFIKSGNKIPTKLECTILDQPFECSIKIIIDRLKLAPGTFYQKFISTAIKDNLTSEETLKQLLLQKYNTELNRIEKEIKINGQKYNFETLAQQFNTTTDNIKLFIILSDIYNGKFDLENILKRFIYKLTGKRISNIRYITINNQDYTFDQIVDKFKAKGYEISITDLENRFDKILHAHNDDFVKALKGMSRLVKEQLTGKQPFDLGPQKQACSRLKRKILANL